MVMLRDVTDARGPIREQGIHTADQLDRLIPLFALERYGYGQLLWSCLGL